VSFALGDKAYCTMRRPWLTVIALLLCGAGVAALGMMLASRHKPEPTYSGRTVRQWLAGGDFETNRATVTESLFKNSVWSPAFRRYGAETA
jgi:hypothetical protein